MEYPVNSVISYNHFKRLLLIIIFPWGKLTTQPKEISFWIENSYANKITWNTLVHHCKEYEFATKS